MDNITDNNDNDDGDYLLLQPFVEESSTATTDHNQRNRCMLQELVSSNGRTKRPGDKINIYQISGPYALDVLFNAASTNAASGSSSIIFLDADYNDFPLRMNHGSHQMNHGSHQNHHQPYSKSILQRVQIVRVETAQEMALSILTILDTTTTRSSSVGFIGVAVSETLWKNDWTTRNIICT
jgi:hypothetical protein